MCKIHTCNLFISKIMITLEAKDTVVIISDKDYFHMLSISTLLKLSTYPNLKHNGCYLCGRQIKPSTVF